MNCDTKAYETGRKSSIVSTVPALEALLYCTRRPFTPEEEAFLDGGAEYLLAHRLFRSASGRPIRPEWTEPAFPRFYDYDILRGVTFLSRWGARRNKPWRDRAQEALDLLDRWAVGGFRVSRPLPASRNLSWNGSRWIPGEPIAFDLLRAVRSEKAASETLAEEWNHVVAA